MKRKLATIRKISNIRPITGADSIELATVDGWSVVVAKNANHKVGDLVVYCEVDSFLPIQPEFEFLRKSSFKKMRNLEGFRLKTLKLRGELSQGLLIKLEDVRSIIERKSLVNVTFFEGDDITELLGIIKYEQPLPAQLEGKVKGFFPSFLQKTDEERIQNLVEEYEKFKFGDFKFYATEKLDGSSATFYLSKGIFGVCSRNLELLETEENSFWKVARQMDIENKLLKTKLNVAIQGELIGEGIQGNPYNISGQTVRIFNVFLIDEQRKMNLNEFKKFLQEIELDSVPIIDNFKLPDTIEDLLKLSEGKSSLNSNVEREGYVVRSLDMKISFKCISNKFLLGEKD